MTQTWLSSSAFLALVAFMAQPGLATLTIEMPQGSFCELDNVSACQFDQGDCLRYDPGVAGEAPSVVTFLTQGKISNALQVYAALLWVRWEHNLPVFIEDFAKKFAYLDRKNE